MSQLTITVSYPASLHDLFLIRQILNSITFLGAVFIKGWPLVMIDEIFYSSIK